MNLFLFSLLLFSSLANAQSTNSTIKIKLISLDQCEHAAGKLYNCIFETSALPASGILVHHIPLHTKITLEREGNCSTAFPVEITAQSLSKSKKSVQISMVHPETKSLTADGARESGGIEFSSNNWFKMASFDESCRTHLSIKQDELDISNHEDGSKFLDQFINSFKKSIRNRDIYRDYSLYQPAIKLLKNLTDVLLNKINDTNTNEVLDQNGSIVNMIEKMKKSSTIAINSNQRALLSKIQDFLDMQRSSGTTQGKKISDFISAEDLKIIQDLSDKTLIIISEADLRKNEIELSEYCSDAQSIPALFGSFLGTSEKNELESISKSSCLN